MPQASPSARRVDREALNDVELYVTKQVLYRLADAINAATRTGAIYGQIILPPEEAGRKRALHAQMEG